MTNKQKQEAVSIYIAIGLLFLILIGGIILLFSYWPSDSGDEYLIPLSKSGEGITYKDLIVVNNIKENQIIESPLSLRGQARGTWFFEGDFPVKLFDGNGALLAAAPAQAEGDWMTEEFVFFIVELEFESPQTETGILILEKDNPSGLPEYADEFQIPVRFYVNENTTQDRGDIGYTAEKMSEEIARNFVLTQALTYVFDGMNLELIEGRALDLINCQECYEFEFVFESRQSGYGDRTGQILAQVITPHNIVVTIERGEVIKVITDEIYDEINKVFLE